MSQTGCRALTANEMTRIREELRKKSTGIRDECLFVMGCEMGPRISELLSLRLCDVVEDGKIRADVMLCKRFRKRKPESMYLPVPPASGKLLRLWVRQLCAQGWNGKENGLFPGWSGRNRSIRPQTARKILTDAARRAGLTGRISTHSMRKTFAQRVYQTVLRRRATGQAMDPITETMQALGHHDPKNTMLYLGLSGVNTREIVMEAWKDENG